MRPTLAETPSSGETKEDNTFNEGGEGENLSGKWGKVGDRSYGRSYERCKCDNPKELINVLFTKRSKSSLLSFWAA